MVDINKLIDNAEKITKLKEFVSSKNKTRSCLTPAILGKLQNGQTLHTQELITPSYIDNSTHQSVIQDIIFTNDLSAKKKR